MIVDQRSSGEVVVEGADAAAVVTVAVLADAGRAVTWRRLPGPVALGPGLLAPWWDLELRRVRTLHGTQRLAASVAAMRAGARHLVDLAARWGVGVEAVETVLWCADGHNAHLLRDEMAAARAAALGVTASDVSGLAVPTRPVALTPGWVVDVDALLAELERRVPPTLLAPSDRHAHPRRPDQMLWQVDVTGSLSELGVAPGRAWCGVDDPATTVVPRPGGLRIAQRGGSAADLTAWLDTWGSAGSAGGVVRGEVTAVAWGGAGDGLPSRHEHGDRIVVEVPAATSLAPAAGVARAVAAGQWPAAWQGRRRPTGVLKRWRSRAAAHVPGIVRLDDRRPRP